MQASKSGSEPIGDIAHRGQPQNLSFTRALLIAAAIEAIFLLGSGGLFLNAVAQIQPHEPPIEVSIAEPEKKEPPREKPLPRPRPEPKPPEPRPAPVPVIKPPPPTPVTPEVLNNPVPSPPIESPVVVAQAPVVKPPPPMTDAVAEREAAYAARVKAAIQAAVVYPPAARSMGFVGRARVEFVLRDGVPGQIRIIQGSGTGMIDRAAMAAVSSATYPEAPDSLKGKALLYQVYVLFELNATR